ncbi:hypothetical protein [Cellulomonas sp. Y8]|nr:hypothetical protein [Cellulomonas sp. Y8]
MFEQELCDLASVLRRKQGTLGDLVVASGEEGAATDVGAAPAPA